MSDIGLYWFYFNQCWCRLTAWICCNILDLVELAATTGSDCTNTGLYVIRVHTGWMEARQHTAKIRSSMNARAAFDTGGAVLSGIKAAGINILMFANNLLVCRKQMFNKVILLCQNLYFARLAWMHDDGQYNKLFMLYSIHRRVTYMYPFVVIVVRVPCPHQWIMTSQQLTWLLQRYTLSRRYERHRSSSV